MARSLLTGGQSLLMLLVTCRSPAIAETIQFRFSGVVTELTGGTGVLGEPGVVQVGDSFTGRFAYEVGSANPDQAPADATDGRYNLINFEIQQSTSPISPFAVRVIHRPGLATLPPVPPDPGRDSVAVIGNFQDISGTTRPVSLRLEADFGAALVDDSLPQALPLLDFPEAQEVLSIVVIGLMGHPSQLDAGRLTSLTLIPEPTSLTPAVVITCAAALQRRRDFCRRVGSNP